MNRLALVFGIAEYYYYPGLKNPLKDAKDVKEKLISFGFNVTIGLNLTRDEMLAKLDEFARNLDENTSDIVFYYAGHGCSISESAC